MLGPLEIEHLTPLACGGEDDENNLWLACARCNRFKAAQVAARDPHTGEVHTLFNPREQYWSQHFEWAEGGMIIQGTTPVGRATVEALRLNHEQSVAVRRNWIAAGWHPPSDDRPVAPDAP